MLDMPIMTVWLSGTLPPCLLGCLPVAACCILYACALDLCLHAVHRSHEDQA